MLVGNNFVNQAGTTYPSSDKMQSPEPSKISLHTINLMHSQTVHVNALKSFNMLDSVI